MTGLTSNPTIFDHAIKNSGSYDAAIRERLKAGKSGEDLFFEIALEDITQAADLFRPIHERTAYVDGWVSLEVSPVLAHDTRTMELGHLPYRKGAYEDYVGLRGLTTHGEKKWRKHVEDVIAHLVAALEPDDVVLGGGNVKHLDDLPRGCRAGDNANAFLGGFRAWEQETAMESQAGRKRPPPAHDAKDREGRPQ